MLIADVANRNEAVFGGEAGLACYDTIECLKSVLLSRCVWQRWETTAAPHGITCSHGTVAVDYTVSCNVLHDIPQVHSLCLHRLLL